MKKSCKLTADDRAVLNAVNYAKSVSAIAAKVSGSRFVPSYVIRETKRSLKRLQACGKVSYKPMRGYRVELGK